MYSIELATTQYSSGLGAFTECNVKLSYGYYAALGTVRKHLII